MATWRAPSLTQRLARLAVVLEGVVPQVQPDFRSHAPSPRGVQGAHLPGPEGSSSSRAIPSWPPEDDRVHRLLPAAASAGPGPLGLIPASPAICTSCPTAPKLASRQ